MAEERRPGPFEPIKINLVEQEGWKKYDTASGALDWVSDSGWEDFKHMDIRTLEGLIGDIAEVPPKGKKKSKLNFNSDELRYLAEQLKDQSDQLEETRRIITDAATDMYEVAAIPNDGDVEWAMENATKDLIGYAKFQENIWDEILTESVRKGPMEWSPRKKYKVEDILKQLSERITLEHKKGTWERYVLFDFWEAPIVQNLFSRHRGSPEAYEELKREFKQLSDGYVADLFKHLDKNMQTVDMNNRADWTSSWKSILTHGEAWDAQKELVEVLKTMPPETEYAG